MITGLDPSGYRASHRTSNNEDETGSPPMSDEERFAASERLINYSPNFIDFTYAHPYLI